MVEHCTCNAKVLGSTPSVSSPFFFGVVGIGREFNTLQLQKLLFYFIINFNYLAAAIAQLGERQTEDLKAARSIRACGKIGRSIVASISACHADDPGSIPGDREKKLIPFSRSILLQIHRSLMVRICGFHPQDPGSIPGDEARSWEDVKKATSQHFLSVFCALQAPK